MKFLKRLSEIFKTFEDCNYDKIKSGDIILASHSDTSESYRVFSKFGVMYCSDYEYGELETDYILGSRMNYSSYTKNEVYLLSEIVYTYDFYIMFNESDSSDTIDAAYKQIDSDLN